MVAETVEASFPSQLERSVASALLLLSSSPSKGRSSNSISPESSESSGFCASKTSGGSSTAEAIVDEESSHDQHLTVFAFFPGLHELKLKIVRKKRSKSIWISNGKKLKSCKAEPSSSESVSEITTTTTIEASSSSSSGEHSWTNAADHKLGKQLLPAGHMAHKAAAILRVLSDGSASEVKIRQLLGDSPSTSKALRMLLKLREVKRLGAGGRTDPFIYTIAS